MMFNNTNKTLLILCIIILLIGNMEGAEIYGRDILSEEWNGEEIDYLESQIYCQFNSSLTQAQINNILKSYPVTVNNIYLTNYYDLEVDNSELFGVLDLLNLDKNVEFAEPSLIGTILTTHPNDPYYDGTTPATYWHQWGLYNYGQSPPGGTFGTGINV